MSISQHIIRIFLLEIYSILRMNISGLLFKNHYIRLQYRRYRHQDLSCFYNGTKKVEDRSEFRLSSAYENPTEDPDLELRVTMLNVNDGHNNELMEHCRTLKEYAQYVARVRKYAAEPGMALEEAVERAVEECIKEGILEEFLTKNKAEVIKMSIYEYDKEFEEKKLRKAEYEAGRQDGIEIGRKDGIEIGRQAGIKVGEENVLKKIYRETIKERNDSGRNC